MIKHDFRPSHANAPGKQAERISNPPLTDSLKSKLLQDCKILFIGPDSSFAKVFCLILNKHCEGSSGSAKGMSLHDRLPASAGFDLVILATAQWHEKAIIVADAVKSASPGAKFVLYTTLGEHNERAAKIMKATGAAHILKDTCTNGAFLESLQQALDKQ